MSLGNILTLMPIFIEENGFWDSELGADFIAEALFSYHEIHGTYRSICVSNSRKVLTMAANAGWETKHVEITDDREIGWLPDGTAHALQAITSPDCPNDRALVVDFRRPLLKVDGLNDMVRRANDDNIELLVGTTPLRDHPCQFQSCLRHIQSTIVILNDDEDDADKSTKTRPFHYPWDFSGVLDNGFYLKRVGVIGSSFVKTDLQPGEAGEPVWEKVAKETAVIHYTADENEAGNVWDSAFDMYPPRCRKGKQQDSVILRFERNCSPRRASIKIIPFTEQDNHLAQTSIVTIFSTQDSVDVEVARRNYSGFAIQVFEPITDGAYDIKEPFLSDNAPWRLNDELRMVNTLTGEIIQGRQEMPPAYDASGAASIVPLSSERLEDRNHVLSSITPYMQDEYEVFSLNNRYDFLCLQALHGEADAE